MSYLEYKKKKKEEESGKESQTSSRSYSSFGQYKEAQKFGVDTFDSDLQSIGTAISDAYSGWQTQETMLNTRKAVESMHKRLTDYQSYQSKYGGNDMSEVLSGYQSVLDDWDNLSTVYGNFQNADAFSTASKKWKMDEQFKGLTYDDVQKQLKQYGADSDEYSYLSNYTGYTDLNDFERALSTADRNSKYYSDLTTEKNKWELDHTYDKYKQYTQAEDFAEKSQYQNTAKRDGILAKLGFDGSDETYEYINDVDGARDEIVAKYKEGNGATEIEQHGYQYMTDEEKAMYNYLYNTDKKLADQYLKDMEISLNKRVYDKSTETWEKWSDESALKSIGMDLATPVLNLAGGVGSAVETVKEVVTGREYNPYAPGRMVGNAATDMRKYVGDNIEESTNGAVRFLHDTAFSMADSGLRTAALGKLGTVVAGLGAYQQTAKDLTEAGASDAQVQSVALISGAAELAFEYMGVDNLFKIKNVDSLKSGIMAALKQAGAEGLEETGTEITNILADTLIRGDSSELISQYHDMIERGYSVKEANTAIAGQIGKQIGMAALGGALSGAGMGGIYSGMQYKGLSDAGKTIKDNYTVDDLAGLASELDGYQEYIDLINSGKATNAHIGSLYEQVESETTSTFETESGKAVMRSVANMANEMGDSKNSGIIASAFQKMIDKQKLSAEEKAVLKTDTAKAIAAELKKSGIPNLNVTESLLDAKDKVKRTYDIYNTSKADEAAIKQRAAELTKGEETVVDGETATVEGVRVEDGVTTVLTSRGEVKAEDADLSAYDAEIVASAENMSPEMADLFVSQYEKGTDVESYRNAFNLAYTYGRSQMGLTFATDNIKNLDTAKISEIYKAGRTAKISERQKAIDAIKSKYVAKKFYKGTVDDSVIDYTNSGKGEVDWDELTEGQRESIEVNKALYAGLGINVRLSTEGIAKGYNGYYDPKKNEVVLDVYAGVRKYNIKDADLAIISTSSHELTHWMEKKSPELYAKLQDHVFETLSMSDGVSDADRIAEEIANSKGKLSRSEAISEIVARACEDMLSMSEMGKEALSRLTDSERKTIFTKVKEIIQDMIDYINEILGKYKSKSDEAIALREYQDRLKEQLKLWEAAMKEAVEVNQSLTEASVSEDKQLDPIMYSARNLEDKVTPTYEELIVKPPVNIVDVMSGMKSDSYANMKAEAKRIASDEKWYDHPHYNNDTESYIFLTKDTFSHAFNNLKAEFGEDTIRCVAHIPEIIRESILVHVGDPKDILKSEKKVYTFIGAVKGIAGVEPVKLTVKSFDVSPIERVPQKIREFFEKNGFDDEYNKLYDVKALEVINVEKIEKESDASGKGNGETPLARATSDSFKISVSEMLRLVNGDATKYLPENLQFSRRDSEGNELTPEQQEFFKDSKVRDEDGNLRVVYHGSEADFTVFDRTKARANMDIQGSFFSPWDIDAGGYGGNVRAFYLNIKNPASESMGYKALRMFKGQNGAGIKAREYLESLGYDGVNNGDEEYIAFYPEQIKLISNAKPTNDADIRYAERTADSRTLLTNALYTVAQTDQEKELLAEYRKNIDLINIKESELAEIRKQIKEISFSSGPRDMKKLDYLNKRAEKIRNSISWYDKKLLNLEATEHLKAVVDREKAKIRKRLKEDTKQELAAQKERIEKRAKIESITQKSLVLNKWMLNNSKDEHIPDAMKPVVIQLLKAIDFSSKQFLGTNVPTQKDISLAKALSKVKDMITDGTVDGDVLYELYGADMDGKMKELVDSIADYVIEDGDNAYVLNKMTLEQLETLDKVVSSIKAAVSKMNRFHVAHTKKSISNVAQQGIVYLNGLGKAKLAKSKLGKGVSHMLKWGNATPYYAFKRFGEGGELVYEALMDGWDKFSFNIKKVIDKANEIYDEEQVKNWSEEVKTFEILLPATKEQLADPNFKGNHQEIQLTTAQIMSLYCLQKREQAKGHILGGGIRIADIETKKEAISQSEGVVITESELDKIISSLDAEQIRVADALQKFMNEDCAEWGNEISMKRFGYKAFGEPNYFPIRSDENVTGDDTPKEMEKTLYRLLNMSFTKALTQNANNRIVVENIFDVFAQHTSEMAKYNALALPVLDAVRWFNYKEKGEKIDGHFKTIGIRQSMESAFGKDANNFVSTFLKDINGAENVGRDRIAKGFMSNAKIASVGFNAKVVALQPTSYLRASAVIDNKYLIAGLGRKPKSALAEEHCGMALWKSLGFIDINVQRGVAELIKHDKSTKDKWTETAMKGAGIADRITIGYLWNACEAEIKDKRTDLKVGTDEYYEAVGKRLREIIYATQVVDSTMTRSHMMRSGDTMDKVLTNFASEPTLSYNMLMDAYYSYKLTERQTGNKKEAFNKHGKKLARTMYAYTITAVITSALEAGFEVFRDDEEKDAEDLLKIYLENLYNNMSVLSKIPYAKEVISALQGFTSSRIDTQWMQYFAYSIKGIAKLMSGSGNAYTTTKNLLKAVSYATGVPGYNIWRDANALLDKLGIISIEELEEMFNDTIGDMFPSLKSK